MYLMWFVLGALLSIPLIWLANNANDKARLHLLGASLVVAAVIYIGFSAFWGDATWLVIESAGVLGYGSFYLLAIKFSILWLAVGWAAHPIWDVVLHLNGAGAHIVPEWYAIACVSFDVSIALYIVYCWRKVAVSASSTQSV